MLAMLNIHTTNYKWSVRWVELLSMYSQTQPIVSFMHQICDNICIRYWVGCGSFGAICLTSRLHAHYFCSYFSFLHNIRNLITTSRKPRNEKRLNRMNITKVKRERWRVTILFAFRSQTAENFNKFYMCTGHSEYSLVNYSSKRKYYDHTMMHHESWTIFVCICNVYA